MTTAYIALGANLGNRTQTLQLAIERIAALPHTQLIAQSTFHQTAPVGGPANQPEYLNAAVAVHTQLAPRQLLDALLQIEHDLGRDRTNESRNGPRNIDLDIVLYGNQIIGEPQLQIPHPRLHERHFVLAPLAEIAPDAVHPILKLSVAELLRDFGVPQIAIYRTIAEWRKYRQAISHGATIVFVPTMGALHDGHASLVRAARVRAGATGLVVASIFVNPTQFGPKEDFNRYPRPLEHDLQILQAAGCNAVFVPTVQEMYPGTETFIDPGPLANVLEGAIRPGHFRGVCTVVVKLLNIIAPAVLYLGQKDYQQQAILRQTIADLNIPVEVITAPTMREPDGLAMSSRNAYLTPEQRANAVGLYEALTAAKAVYAAGEQSAETLKQIMANSLAARGLEVQYALPVHARSLAPFSDRVIPPAVLVIAAKLGTTRLIDNMPL